MCVLFNRASEKNEGNLVRLFKHNGVITKGEMTMKYDNLNQKKGVAGLNILLSLIAMLFMIGIIVMVFVIAGARLKSTVTDTEAQNVINATYNSIDDVVDWFPTFIVLGALVVLILLVVIIMNSIKSSGVTEGA